MSKRVYLVTGGNRGIGLAIVKGLARQDHSIILMGTRDLNLGLEAAKNIEGTVIPVELDLSRRVELKNQLEKIKEEHGSIDVLVNNAGVLKEGSFLAISDEDFEETLRVNTFAIYDLIRFCVPDMIAQKYGRIVNMSSGWGSFDEGLSGPFAYSVSKSALNALTKTLAQELPNFVKVNSMCPGWVRTRMGGESATRSPEQGAETALWLATLDEDGPTGKFFRDQNEIGW